MICLALLRSLVISGFIIISAISELEEDLSTSNGSSSLSLRPSDVVLIRISHSEKSLYNLISKSGYHFKTELHKSLAVASVLFII